MIQNIDVNKIKVDIKRFKELEHPDDELVKNILSTLQKILLEVRYLKFLTFGLVED